jgi:hypothetical protein
VFRRPHGCGLDEAHTKAGAFQIRWPFRITEVADGLDKDKPIVAGPWRRGEGAKRAQRIARLRPVNVIVNRDLVLEPYRG